MDLIQYENGTEAANDGLHLPGLSEQDAETLCGYAWSGFKYNHIDGASPTCTNCISIVKELFINRGYTKKQISQW